MIKICYFSGTGNTLWSAKKIAELSGEECELINMGTEAEKKEIILEAGAVVLLTPSYAYGVPKIVHKFVKKAVFKTSYIAAFVTYGSNPGGTLAVIANILKRKGTKAAFFGRIPAVENYFALFGAPNPETTEKRLQLQVTTTEEAARCLAERRTNSTFNRKCVNTFHPLSAFVFLLFSLALKFFYKLYKVSGDCDGCGVCEKICPVSAITIKNGRPEFCKKCEHCQGCLNWCPKHAIQFGRLKPDCPRYHHPEINAADMVREKAD